MRPPPPRRRSPRSAVPSRPPATWVSRRAAGSRVTRELRVRVGLPGGISPQGPTGATGRHRLPACRCQLQRFGRVDFHAAERLRVRTNFNALALFSPSVQTDAAGVAHVNVDLPDNLTRYRVMAVAADSGGRFGSGESTLTARLPLQIRPSAPRFANFGDRFELPVVRPEPDRQGRWSSTWSRRRRTSRSPTRTVSAVKVPANDRVEVRFPVKTDAAGTARLPDHRDATVGDADSADRRVPRVHAGHDRGVRDLRRGRQRRRSRSR